MARKFSSEEYFQRLIRKARWTMYGSVVIVLLLICFAVWATFQYGKKNSRLEARTKELEAEVALLNEEKQNLRARLQEKKEEKVPLPQIDFESLKLQKARIQPIRDYLATVDEEPTRVDMDGYTAISQNKMKGATLSTDTQVLWEGSYIAHLQAGGSRIFFSAIDKKGVSGIYSTDGKEVKLLLTFQNYPDPVDFVAGRNDHVYYYDKSAFLFRDLYGNSLHVHRLDMHGDFCVYQYGSDKNRDWLFFQDVMTHKYYAYALDGTGVVPLEGVPQ